MVSSVFFRESVDWNLYRILILYNSNVHVQDNKLGKDVKANHMNIYIDDYIYQMDGS